MARADDTLLTLPDYLALKKAPSKKQAVNLLTEGHQLRKVMKEAEERLKEIKSELTQIQIMNDLPGLRYGEFCFIATQREGKLTLSKEALIDNGVEPATIAASMKRGKPYIETELSVIGEAAAKRMAKEEGE